MRASSPPTFHTARFQVEHMLGERKGKKEGGVSLEKAAPAPPTKAVTIACIWGVRDGSKVPSIQGHANGVSSLAQRRLSGP